MAAEFLNSCLCSRDAADLKCNRESRGLFLFIYFTLRTWRCFLMKSGPTFPLQGLRARCSRSDLVEVSCFASFSADFTLIVDHLHVFNHFTADIWRTELCNGDFPMKRGIQFYPQACTTQHCPQCYWVSKMRIYFGFSSSDDLFLVWGVMLSCCCGPNPWTAAVFYSSVH